MSTRRGPLRRLRTVLGRHVAPPRFLMFVLVMAGVAVFWQQSHPAGWADPLVIGFDTATVVFAVSLLEFGRDHRAEQMRRHSAQNEANRTVVLLITGVVALAIMAAIAGELPAARHGNVVSITKLVLTLSLAWIFTNLVFMMHYAHMHYTLGNDGLHDRGGFEFPGTPEPDYWDFLYFSFTAGMSFAASDVNVTRGGVRRILVLHCFLSFVFNIGVLAFSINVLAGAAS